MWLPPFKIIKGLFAFQGEFSKPDGSPYEGPYYKTYTGQAYAGSEPSADQVPLTPDLHILGEGDKYVDGHGDLNSLEVSLVYPEPKDYKKGFFTRFFILDTRTNKLVETEKEGYDRYRKELFLKGTTLKWILEKPLKDIFSSGFLYKGAGTRNRENVLKASVEIPLLKNYITDYGQFVEVESDVEGFKFMELPVAEQRRIIRKVKPNIQEEPLKPLVPRFKKAPKKRLTKTNLYTPGGRFKIEGSNIEYKGFYHIHPTKGAMEGAVHVNEYHRRLIPLSGPISIDTAVRDTVSTAAITVDQNIPTQPTISSPSYNSGGGGSSGGGGGGGY